MPVVLCQRLEILRVMKETRSRQRSCWWDSLKGASKVHHGLLEIVQRSPTIPFYSLRLNLPATSSFRLLQAWFVGILYLLWCLLSNLDWCEPSVCRDTLPTHSSFLKMFPTQIIKFVELKTQAIVTLSSLNPKVMGLSDLFWGWLKSYPVRTEPEMLEPRFQPLERHNQNHCQEQSKGDNNTWPSPGRWGRLKILCDEH